MYYNDLWKIPTIILVNILTEMKKLFNYFRKLYYRRLYIKLVFAFLKYEYSSACAYEYADDCFYYITGHKYTEFL